MKRLIPFLLLCAIQVFGQTVKIQSTGAQLDTAAQRVARFISASEVTGLGAKMDSIRVNVLRGQDTTRLKVNTNVLRGQDTTRLKVYADGIVGPKMDSTRVNTLRGQDSARAVVREGAKANTSHVHAGTDIGSGTVDAAYLKTNTSSSAGVVASGSGQNAKVWKTDASGNPDWREDATATGGVAFSDLTSATNSTASMVVGAGASLTYTSTGVVNANQFGGETDVSGVEFGYLDGVTSAIQNQFGAKLDTSSATKDSATNSHMVWKNASGVIKDLTIQAPLAFSAGTISADTGAGKLATNADLIALTIDGLANVLSTGKSSGNVLTWNGTNWVDSTGVSTSDSARASHVADSLKDVVLFKFDTTGVGAFGSANDLYLNATRDTIRLRATTSATTKVDTARTITIAGTTSEITSSAGAQSLGANRTWTLSLPTAIDLGGKTSFEMPNAASPTVNTFGQIAGDNDAWATSRGAPMWYDGTATTFLLGALTSDVPTNGQVPKWNTGGTITWEADNTGSVTFDAIGAGTNAGALLKVGLGSVLTFSSTGKINANMFDSVTTVDRTEFGYLDGVTSALQGQIAAKTDTGRTITAGDGLSGGGTMGANRTLTVNFGSAGGIQTTADSLNVKTYGTTLAKTVNGLAVDTNVVTGTAYNMSLKITGTRSTIQTKADTSAIFAFGGGGGNATDTAAFTTSTIYGSFFNKGTDTLYITSLYCVMRHGIGLDTIDVQVLWDDTLGTANATKLNTAAFPVNSVGGILNGVEDVAFAATKIPPNNWVWCTTPTGITAGRKPTYLSATISGYRGK